MKTIKLKKLPLEGIKVIDAASYIAAPLVSALMSDYGAEVIKIESLIFNLPMLTFHFSTP